MRMAMAIVANALTFHTSITSYHDVHNARRTAQTRVPFGNLLKSQVLGTWRYILREINYWPIFRIAIRKSCPPSQTPWQRRSSIAIGARSRGSARTRRCHNPRPFRSDVRPPYRRPEVLWQRSTPSRPRPHCWLNWLRPGSKLIGRMLRLTPTCESLIWLVAPERYSPLPIVPPPRATDVPEATMPNSMPQ